ncbi:hypothetical protein TBLA_0G03260 [Henningerozyma blattae CBS 6284]|uniref:Uncharacterized protein n=1 Tax=Henningerozyma blattae (strain ATCC 34711 / CBS 6284 / DSM 70876 / NBRC 10599 / NRRL Y-10934 / UCD 77-7) TaxID=1071380 RepID=I2H7B1_HENB6|nr:hypothetical protein TBLA_0G03260 [Tetrapisispora blattae CBS 6284]CCH62263.1 hypothetical protein TBLA_0G03260 [Tetrapisispora blattae CBS 6284]
MLHSENIHCVLEQSLSPVNLTTISFHAPPLQTAAILSKENGSILSFVNSSNSNDKYSNNTSGNNVQSLNNLKMIGLLIKDKWHQDEFQLSAANNNHHEVIPNNIEQSTNNISTHTNTLENSTSNILDNNNNKISINNNNLYEIKAAITSNFVRIYNYEVEEWHTCVSQIPSSDLLIVLIGSSSYPYGLLLLKMKEILRICEDLYGYKLG